MKNRIVGTMIIIIAILIGFIIFSFNTALADIVSASCSHGSSCPMWGSITFQTNVSIGIMAFVLLIGIYLFFFGDNERKTINSGSNHQIQKLDKDDYEQLKKDLTKNEKIVLDTLIENDGSIFQSEIVENLEFPKAKVTRILDKLEGKKIVERKRRGMSNIVILKA